MTATAKEPPSQPEPESAEPALPPGPQAARPRRDASEAIQSRMTHSFIN